MTGSKENDPRLLLLAPNDSVFVLRDQIEAGESILVEGKRVTTAHRLGLGQKIARKPVGIGRKCSNTTPRSDRRLRGSRLAIMFIFTISRATTRQPTP